MGTEACSFHKDTNPPVTLLITWCPAWLSNYILRQKDCSDKMSGGCIRTGASAFSSLTAHAYKDGGQGHAMIRMQRDGEACMHGKRGRNIQAYRARSKAVALTQGALHAMGGPLVDICRCTHAGGRCCAGCWSNSGLRARNASAHACILKLVADVRPANHFLTLMCGMVSAS